MNIAKTMLIAIELDLNIGSNHVLNKFFDIGIELTGRMLFSDIIMSVVCNCIYSS